MEGFRWGFHNIDAPTLIQFLLLPVVLFIFSKATMFVFHATSAWTGRVSPDLLSVDPNQGRTLVATFNRL